MSSPRQPATIEETTALGHRSWPGHLTVRDGFLAVAILALLILMTLTPAFFTAANLLSLINNAALVGCVAVGMTLITLSGNVLSFALGATTGSTAMVFAAMAGFGTAPAIIAAGAFAVAITAFQGFVTGFFRANPIIVSIAALALITGLVDLVSGGQTVYASQPVAAFISSKLLGVPAAALIFIGAAAVAELILRTTRFGRHIVMIGTNLRAADAAGVTAWRTTLGTYALAGLFTGFAGIMLGARYGSGNMEFGLGYDYSAIAAVLVGGTFIGGGEGSILRTMLGMAVISVFSAILLLHGVSTEYQALLIGLVVLVFVLAQGRGRAA